MNKEWIIMNIKTLKKLQAIASVALTVAAIIFIFLCIFGYGGEWSLPAALGCSALSLLFQTAFKVRGDTGERMKNEQIRKDRY